MEKVWQVKVVVTHNPNQVQVCGFAGRTYEFMAFPQSFPLPVSDEEMKMKMDSIQSFTNDMQTEFGLRLAYLNDIESWFCYCEKDLLIQARGDNFAPKLWAKVIYGEKTMEEVRLLTRQRLGQDVMVIWQRERRRNYERVRSRDHRFTVEHNAYMAVKQPVLNNLEVQLILNLVDRVHTEYQNGRRVIIGVDRSGRPLAQAAIWNLERLGLNSCRLFNIDPHPLAHRIANRYPGKSRIVHGKFARMLREQSPELFGIISERPEEILVVDDQTGYGQTRNSILGLFQHICGGELAIPYLTFDYEGYESNILPPSWWFRKELIGVKSAPVNQITLHASWQPSLYSVEFYDKLKGIILQRPCLDKPQQGLF